MTRMRVFGPPAQAWKRLVEASVPKAPAEAAARKRRRLSGHPAQPVGISLIFFIGTSSSGVSRRPDANAGPSRMSRNRPLTAAAKCGYIKPALKKISRRTFLGGAAAAATGTVLAGPSCGRDNAAAGPVPKPRFTLGLASYTFREFDLDATLAMARRLGFERISLKDMHLPLASGEEAIRAAAAKVRAAGLDLYGCGVVYMKSAAEVDRAFAYARTGG